jgi:putative phosphoesterase
MKIGIFSDVHGHLDELHKTLALLKSLEVNQTVCAGDLVEKGGHSDAVVEVMRELAIPCVQGNHDAKARFGWLNDQAPLLERSISFLSNLPLSLTFEWVGVTVYLCHANPWEDSSVYVYPDRPTKLFQLIAEAVAPKVIVLGHTHQPMCIHVDGKIILNAGSIYGNRGMEQRTCGVLSLPDCAFEIYDIETGAHLPLTIRTT